MNLTDRLPNLNHTFSKNFISVTLAFTINCINGAFVYTYFKSHVFYRDPRYVLYIHLVINDMIMLTMSVVLQIVSYSTYLSLTSCCILLLILGTTNQISLLNLAAMAVERYIAVCRPLHHVHICTVQRVYTVITLTWIVSFIAPLTDILIVLATQPLSVFSWIVTCHPSRVFSTQYHKALKVAVQVLQLSLVFLTLITTYLKVLFAAQAASGSNQASARNARNTILLHGVQLLMCMLAYISPFITLLLATAWPYIFYISFLLTNMLPRLLSPLIYGIRDQKFNTHLRLHFCCKLSSSEEKKLKLRDGAQRWSKH